MKYQEKYPYIGAHLRTSMTLKVTWGEAEDHIGDKSMGYQAYLVRYGFEDNELE